MLFRNYFLVLCAIIAFNSQAQMHLVGVKSGVNLTNTTGYERSYKLGFAGGFTYEYLFKNKISFGCDVLYAQKGYALIPIGGDKLDPVLGIVTVSPNENSPTKIYHRYDFISVPIKVSFCYGKKLYGMGSIGFMPSYMIAYKLYFENYPAENYLTIERAKRFEISGLLEVGVGYQFKNNWHIVFSNSYFHAFNGINGTNYYYTDAMKNYGFNASLGLKYQFGNK